MIDQTRTINAKTAIAAIAGAGDNTPQVSAIIDRRGFDALTFLISTGVLADADAAFTVLLEHDDVVGFGTAVAVPDEALISQGSAAPETDAGFTFAADGQVRKIGYRGTKGFVRMTITPANNTGAWPIAVLALLGKPYFSQPTQGTT